MRMAFDKPDCHFYFCRGIWLVECHACGIRQNKLPPCLWMVRTRRLRPNKLKAMRIFVAIVFLNRHGVAVCSVECHARGIRERRMPEQWQCVESNAIVWHSSAWIAIGLVTEDLSQPRSSLQNTVRRLRDLHCASTRHFEASARTYWV